MPTVQSSREMLMRSPMTMLAISAFLSLEACIPIVSDADLSSAFKPHEGSIATLAADEKIVLLGIGDTKDDHDLLSCVRDQISSTIPGDRIVDPQRYRRMSPLPP